GDYFVRATYSKPLAGGPAFIVNPNAAPARSGYIPTYFSNASDITNAGMISLKAGETVDRVDLQLAPAPTVNIRGTISDSRTGSLRRFFCKCKVATRGAARRHFNPPPTHPGSTSLVVFPRVPTSSSHCRWTMNVQL